MPVVRGLVRRGYYAASPADDPTGPASGNVRVLRGGSWNSGPNYACSTARSWFTPGERFDCGAGFRVARTQ